MDKPPRTTTPPAAPKSEKAMNRTERDMRTKDVANAAGLLAEATRSAPDRSLKTVSTPYGDADVILDNNGADVVLHDEQVTVHVRLVGAENAR